MTSATDSREKARHEILLQRGWSPIVVDRVVDTVQVGSKTIPVVSGQEVAGWIHPELEFAWPTSDAILLEVERIGGDEQAVRLLGPVSSTPLRREKAART